MSSELLKSLGLDAINAGTYLGNGEWSSATSGELITPVNPTTGEPIAQVRATTEAEYETVVARAQEAFKVWRTTPAPRRGEAVRLCGEALRRHKDALGSLVALEMGKSKPEGDGEVQEMIDIADFAVGQSRMLYGYTMHSERPGHRMYEQYHPLGLVGIISAFNFPVAVWSWNSFLAAICGDVCIWKPSNKTPLTAIASLKICNDALREAGFPDIFFLINDAGTALSEKMVDDRRVPLISFTGSTQVPHRQREGRTPPLLPAGARRQQRDHPGRNRRPQAGRAGHRVRRRRHRRPALHHHPPPDRAPLDLRRRAGHPGQGLQAGGRQDRRSDRCRQPDGPAEQRRRRAAVPRCHCPGWR